MIRLILSGGLGNQMFQYAAARALSTRENTPLSIDKQILTKKTKATSRNYELDIFKINAPVKTHFTDKWTIKAFLLFKKPTFIFSTIFSIFCDEKAQFFDSRFNELSKNTALFGYFQNEKYFHGIELQIREDFTFKRLLESKNKETANLMSLTNSVSIHIRRGDYLNANSNLKVLDIEYYQKAIRYITEKISEIHFFIFSDDTDWAKQNLNLEDHKHTFIDWNKGEDSYIDMQLMSLCKHNVIANSSFSWWGAWLNTNQNKIVLAPDTWYKKDKPYSYPEGFSPKTWIVL